MTNRSKKVFRIKAEEIVPLAEGRGACFATDMITCDGRKVAFMYREEPDRDIDRGWRFMSGCESEEYMANRANIAVYDVNTIANYDPDIIPFLDAAVGSAFERPGGEFRRFRGTHGVVLPAGTLTRQWSWQGAAAAAICNPTELRLPPFALQLIARALG